MDEVEITEALTRVVDAWIAQGSSRAVAANTIGVLPDIQAMLLATGYLTLSSHAVGAVGVIPTTEALNLTDPFLCEELASTFRWEFHRRFLAYRNGTD